MCLLLFLNVKCVFVICVGHLTPLASGSALSRVIFVGVKGTAAAGVEFRVMVQGEVYMLS